MNLAKGAAAANKCDRADGSCGWQGLEEVPGSVVQEEKSLEGDQRSEENGMRNWGGLKGRRKVVHVGAEEKPLFELASDAALRWRSSYQAAEERQRSANKGDKSQGNDNGRAARGILEDVVDLGLLAVSRKVHGGDGHIGVARNCKWENGGIEGIRAAE